MQPGEVVAENNTRSFSLKVIRDRVRVLLVAGRPTWDERFLRGVLKQDANIELISFYILRNGTDESGVPFGQEQQELSLIPFPRDEIFQKKIDTFDVIIVLNFGHDDSSVSLATYQRDIDRYVEQGGAFAYLGGDRSFGDAQAASINPFEHVLPVSAAGVADQGNFIAKLTDAGRRHPMTSELDWSALPAPLLVRDLSTLAQHRQQQAPRLLRPRLLAEGFHVVAVARAGALVSIPAEQALTERGGTLRGKLAIQASQTVSAYWLPQPLMRFHAAHPGIALDLTIGNTETVSRAVGEGAADLGFIEGEIDEPALAMRLVAADRLVLLTAPGHPWAQGAAPSAADLAGARWILRERGSGTRSAFEASIRSDGLDPAALDIVMTLPSNEAILTALEAGPYAGVTSERVAANALAAGRLRRIDYALRPRPFRMLWHKERYRTRAARAFEALLPNELA